MSLLRRTPLLFVSAALLAASPAHADSKAWAAAKKALPANLFAVAGVNVGKVKASQLFQTLWPVAMAQAGSDVESKLDKLKATCGFDGSTVDSMVVGVNESQKGAIVIAFSKTTQKDLDACIQKGAKEENKKITISKTGDVEQLSGLDQKDANTLYIRWLAKDVIAIATKPDDKSLLTEMTAGGIAKDKAFSPALANVNTSSAVWLAVNKAQDLPDINAKMTQVYGNADFSAGNIAATGHVVLDSSKAATDAAAQGNQQIAAMKKAGSVPPAFSGVLNTATIKSSGPEVVVSASMAEKDVLALLGSFLGK